MTAIVTKRSIHRRALLRGAGVALALPLLDSMVPALTAQAKTPAAPVRRFGTVYFGNGAPFEAWTPKGIGANFEFSEILKPLERHRSHVTVISGLDNEPSVALVGEPAAGHGRIAPAYLSAVHAKPTAGSDVRAAVTIDQMIADHVGRDTQIRSLELSMEDPQFAGQCDAGFSCIYTNTICWRTPTQALPMANDPRAIFEQLVGDAATTDPAARKARMEMRRSILDAVSEKANHLRGRVGAGDRRKLDGYLESVRAIEKRIELAESESQRELPTLEQPTGIPQDFEAYTRLMFDLQILAYQADLTRVITFLLAREQSGRAYPHIGIPDGHHTLSHHGDEPAKLAKLAKIGSYHAELFASYLDKLKSTPDGDGSLLDNSLILYGSGLGNSNIHDPHQLPTLVAGKGAGTMRGGEHVAYKSKPLANLLVSLVQKMGAPIEKVGDSTSHLTEI